MCSQVHDMLRCCGLVVNKSTTNRSNGVCALKHKAECGYFEQWVN